MAPSCSFASSGPDLKAIDVLEDELAVRIRAANVGESRFCSVDRHQRSERVAAGFGDRCDSAGMPDDIIPRAIL